jgi:hypothetical protein
MDHLELTERASRSSVDFLDIVRGIAALSDSPSLRRVVPPSERTACHDVMTASSSLSLASLDLLARLVSDSSSSLSAVLKRSSQSFPRHHR